MSYRRGGDASFWMGLTFGIFLGAAIALVLTPDTGERNRARLIDKAKDATGSIQGRVQDTQENVQEKM